MRQRRVEAELAERQEEQVLRVRLAEVALAVLQAPQEEQVPQAVRVQEVVRRLLAPLLPGFALLA